MNDKEKKFYEESKMMIQAKPEIKETPKKVDVKVEEKKVIEKIDEKGDK